MELYRECPPCEEPGEGASGILDREGNVTDGSVENYDLTFEENLTEEEFLQE